MLIDKFWKTGQPIIEPIDSRNVWFKSLDMDVKDVVRVFHAEAMDTEELRERIREYDKSLAETIQRTDSDGNTHFPDIKDTTIVYTYVYRKTIRVEKREIVYIFVNRETGQQEQKQWLEIEEEYQENKAQIDATEGVFAAPKPITVKKTIYYQVQFIPDQQLILKQPVTYDDGEVKYKEVIYVGERNPYHFFVGDSREDSSYPFGAAYEMKDILDLSVIFMSMLSIQIGKMNKPQPQVIKEAILNYNEFVNKHWDADFILEYDEQWLSQNKHISRDQVVTYKDTPINDRLFLVMQNVISESIKSTSGAVDSARGEMQYSGQSGVLASQLQMASQTYLKSDENKYKWFINSIMDWLMFNIVNKRKFAHHITGLAEDGVTEVPREVNTNIMNTLNSDDFRVETHMQPSSEIMKQTEKQLILDLMNSGKFPLKAGLKILDFTSVNVDQVMKELEQEQGVAEIADLIEQNPELPQIIQQYLSQKQGNAQPEQP